MDAKKLAKQGRHGDTQLAHLTPGEVVLPKQALNPQVRGLLDALLAAHGQEAERFTVGPNASKNPRTGLLEFYGDNDNDSQGTAGGSRGEGSPGEGGTGHVGGMGGPGQGGDPEAIGREMMGMNTAPLGYGRFTGETVAGTLTNMARNMREAGYRNSGIADTMSDMGVSFGQRLATPGVPALGSFAKNALNTLGRVGGTLVGGLPGGFAGGLLGSALTGDSDEFGRDFARNVVGTLVGGVTQNAGPLGGMVGNQLAKRAMDAAFTTAGPAQRNAKTMGSTAPSFVASPMQSAQPMQMAQADVGYNQSGIINPLRSGAIYDPLAWRRGLL